MSKKNAKAVKRRRSALARESERALLDQIRRLMDLEREQANVFFARAPAGGRFAFAEKAATSQAGRRSRLSAAAVY
jgi:hypothetical protein